jgi:aryl-alcohol dehydrogenase-like predicted oxidoreductase
MYNLLKRQAEVEILPMAKALGVAAVPYSPTAGGLLTGKYRGGDRPGGSRFATNQMYQTRYGDEAYWAAADLELNAATYARVAALTPAPPPATDRSEERTKTDVGR